MKQFCFIFALVLAGIFTSACTREQPEHPTTPSTGTGELVLRFSTGTPETKSTASTLAEAKDGSAFTDLAVVVTRDEVVIAARYVNDFSDASGVAKYTASLSPAQYVSDAIVSFDGMELGEYHIGAYANLCLSADGKSCDNPLLDGKTVFSYEYNGDTYSWPGASHESGGSAATLHDFLTSMQKDRNKDYVSYQQLKTFDSTQPEIGSTYPMLLSRHTHATVRVVDDLSSTDEDGLRLLRPVSKIRVIANNHSDYDVKVTRLWFSSFNAKTSYLMPYLSAVGQPTVPDVASLYRPLPETINPADNTTWVNIAANTEDVLVYPYTMFYESDADLYKMYATFTSTIEDATHNAQLGLPKIFTKSELESMAVGETKTVVLVNPGKNGGMGKAFGLGGASGTTVVTTKTGGTNTTEEMLNVVNGILTGGNEEPYRLTLTRMADINGHAQFSLTRNGKHIVSRIDNGNVIGFTLQSGYNNGNVPNSVYTDLPAGTLLKLADTSSAQSKHYYNNNGAIASSTTTSTNKAQFVWVILDADNRDGSSLKFIDEQTSKVTPVTYIQRNLDITVIMNIYYKAGKHDISFEVDNSYWGDTYGHSSSHDFRYVHVTGVSLNRSELSLDPGDTATLTATVSPATATNKTVHWSSSDDTVATVSDSGVVTAVAAGEATITVTSEEGQKTDTCVVTVS